MIQTGADSLFGQVTAWVSLIFTTYRHFFLRNFEGALVSLLGLVHDFLSSITGGDLGEVSVVISLHFQVEDLGLARGGLKPSFDFCG
jgi:hypothetical protein